MLLDMVLPTVLTPLASLDSPLLLSLPWLEAMLVLADMLPTLLELSMLPRGLLMLSPRPMLMPTTLVDTDMVLAMPDMAMVLAMLPTEPTPMATMERGLLMPSPRLMLLFSTELMVVFMVDMDMVHTPTPMEPTPMPMDMDMASKKSSAFSLIV